jgi:protein-S-isoprenylcysteine O-methyltransferase Ste14
MSARNNLPPTVQYRTQSAPLSTRLSRSSVRSVYDKDTADTCACGYGTRPAGRQGGVDRCGLHRDGRWPAWIQRPSVRARVGATRGHRVSLARVWLPLAVVAMAALYLTFPIALAHAGFSAGILSGAVLVMVVAHAGLLTTLRRPPVIFLAAIVFGIAVNRKWPLPFVPRMLWPLGAGVALGAVSLFVLSLREFRAAGTSVQGSQPTTALVRTGTYRFSRNPIYLSFILLMIGLSIWLNNLWLLVTLAPPVVFISAVVIPREERFLERTFSEYSTYRATVRRWI